MQVPLEWVSRDRELGILRLWNRYVLAIPQPYPCTPTVTHSNDKYSRVFLGLIVSLQLAMGGGDEPYIFI